MLEESIFACTCINIRTDRKIKTHLNPKVSEIEIAGVQIEIRLIHILQIGLSDVSDVCLVVYSVYLAKKKTEGLITPGVWVIQRPLFTICQ